MTGDRRVYCAAARDLQRAVGGVRERRVEAAADHVLLLAVRRWCRAAGGYRLVIVELPA